MKTVVNDTFWNRYKELVRTGMIPYQWKVLNDDIDIKIEKERNDASIPSEKSHAIENFKIAAGRAKGEHYGWVFQDSDVYKWLEAAAYTLKNHWDDDLKKITDEVVDLIADAQEKSGYLNTYFTIMEPDHKYKRLGESHELYCAGHFIEAAVAYHQATGSKKALDIAIKLADHIDASFGPEDGKIHGCDGHEEVEIGLMRLYHLTGEKRYLKLSEYFLLQRGQDPDFFKRQFREDTGKPAIGGLYNAPLTYFQIHAPILEQDSAEGHAVRLVYMCTALADVAASTGNKDLEAVCRKIWRNIVDKRMFITGGIGSTVNGESFTLDYDLPNDTMYCETCASIGLIFFARQMLRLSADGEFGDVMERALYNTALAGMALDGKHFFYVNPLEVVPEKSEKDPTKSHVKVVRPDWLGCACCPPNLARLIASVEDYIYSDRGDSVLINLFIRSGMEKEYEGGKLTIDIDADYPRDGKISFAINNTGNNAMRVGIRIPGWSKENSGEVNGAKADITSDNGYWYIEAGSGETRVTLELDMTPKRWYANPLVSEDIDKVSIARGPQVFCAEGVDNGDNLHLLMLPKSAALKCSWQDELLEGVEVIEADGLRTVAAGEGGLYRTTKAEASEPAKIKMIPYYAWANRGRNEMRVWLYEKE
ncbi:glycoside hydrolase family 127 protein [Butyrivibrio sp. VCB2001]|uniref:glycoside hydrolase family 127 protein n=1 Tax=Butyrivibrio sp. VCB2001 TaxID=1280667 RepID=UPI0004166AD2|nr:beta-L-arabinofuranosidase domain-containing protein [Butyrivibrio sp. VCB2001]